MRNEIIEEIFSYYINSGNFNGLPLRSSKLCSEHIDTVIDLINNNIIEILSETFTMNPHIKRLPMSIPHQIQIDEVIHKPEGIVLYPTASYLKSIDSNETKPFKKMLMEGRTHLEFAFFSLEILDIYFQDPRYDIKWVDYRGYINAKDAYSKDLDGEYIRDIAIGYDISEYEKGIRQRVVGVFVGDFSKLSLKVQRKWEVYLLENEEDFFINKSFYENTINGNWVYAISIFEATLIEVKLINELSTNLGIGNFFKSTYDSDNRPIDYRIIFLPTKSNYLNFIMILEKMFVNNINVDAFTNQGIRQDINVVDALVFDDGTTKGSLSVFKEWLDKNFCFINSANKNIDLLRTLKRIRKMRQKPAHSIFINEYDKTYSQMQDDLMYDLYMELKTIRVFLAAHPLNKNKYTRLLSEYYDTTEDPIINIY